MHLLWEKFCHKSHSYSRKKNILFTWKHYLNSSKTISLTSELFYPSLNTPALKLGLFMNSAVSNYNYNAGISVRFQNYNRIDSWSRIIGFLSRGGAWRRAMIYHRFEIICHCQCSSHSRIQSPLLNTNDLMLDLPLLTPHTRRGSFCT